MTSLGVSCSSGAAFLALADGEAVSAAPDRLELRAGLSDEDQLLIFAEDAARLVREGAPGRVVLLQSESTFQAGHTAWAPRLAMETLFRLVCAREGVPCAYISRQAVRGQFGLKGRGGLDALGKAEVEAAGKYWSAGRLLAALAAVAAERRG